MENWFIKYKDNFISVIGKIVVILQAIFFVLTMVMRFRNNIVRMWQLMMHTSATWEGILENVFKTFLLPVLMLVVGLNAFFKFVYADSNRFQTGIVYALAAFIAYLSAYFTARYFTVKHIVKHHPEKNNRQNIEKLIAYSFVVVFVLKIATIVIPSLFFLQILNIYTVYIVWEGCRVLFDLDEDERGKIMLIISLSVMLLPGMVNKLILTILPGF